MPEINQIDSLETTDFEQKIKKKALKASISNILINIASRLNGL